MKIILRSIAVAAMLVAAASTTACGEGYSTGNRSGVVTKISYKGILPSCRTWEGELAMLSVRSVVNDDGSATMSNAFKFSVMDEAVAGEVQRAMNSGRPVILHYTQWLISPPCRAATTYVVTGVEIASEAPRSSGVEYR